MSDSTSRQNHSKKIKVEQLCKFQAYLRKLRVCSILERMRPFLFHLLTLFPRPYFAPMHETSELLIPCIPYSSSRAYLWACASNHNFGLLGLWIAPAVAIFGKITRSENLGLLIWLVSFGGLRPYTASCTSNTGSIWFHLVPFSRHTVNIYRQCCHAGSFSDKIGHCDTGREKTVSRENILWFLWHGSHPHHIGRK